MTPPVFDILNIQLWKVKMPMYLKALGIHVYLTTIKDSYCLNGKHLEANEKALHALKSTVTPRSRNTYLVAYSDFSIIFFDLLPVFVFSS